MRLRNACAKPALLSMIASAFLTGCATAPHEPMRVSAPVICGTVAPITKQEMARAANELDGMPSNSVIASKIMPDWLRMRDEARACRAER